MILNENDDESLKECGYIKKDIIRLCLEFRNI